MRGQDINFDCGLVVRGATDHEIVAHAQAHAREVHGMEIGREQLLALAGPAEVTP